MKLKVKGDSTRTLTVASVIAMALASNSANAQQTTDDQRYTDAAIVVIGVTKQDSNIQDTPIAITAFSGEKLTAQGINKVDEIATFTPGFNIRGAGNNPTALTLSMRGQIQVDNIATLEPSVGTYLDEMYIARAYGLNVELTDIESVQVLKGPQGTLFGRNTSAGAVLIQTANPRYGEYSGMVSATYGRFDERTGQAVLNLGLSDSLAIRGSLYYQKRDGYKTDVDTGRKYEGRETWNGRVKLGWKPTDTFEVILSGEWYDTFIDGPTRQNLFFNAPPNFGAAKPAVDGIAAADRAQFNGNPNRVSVTPTSGVPGADPRGVFNDTRTQTYMAKFILDTSFGQVRWINGYRGVQSENLVDLDGTSFGGHFTGGTQDLKQYSTELQVTGSGFDDRLHFASGLTYFRETGFDQSRSQLFGATFAAGPTVPAQFVGATEWSNFSGTLDNNSFGMYSQINYELTDALSFIGGLRYSIDDKGVTTQSGDVANNTNVFVRCSPITTAIPCERTTKESFNNLSYTVGFDYDITEDILFYAKHSKGYRSGALQLRTLTLADSVPSQPELVYEQEVGLKTTFLDGRASFNIAGYHNVVKDAQRSPVLAPNGLSQTVIENADTETWGVEVDASVEVATGFTLFANGALTDPKYTRYEGRGVSGAFGSQVIVPVDKRDFRFAGIVEKQFSVGASYKQDFGKVGLDANVVYAWQDKLPQIETPERLLTSTGVGGLGLSPAQAATVLAASETGSLGILNGRIALSFGEEKNFEFALWGKNLLNDQEQQYTLLLSNIYIGTSYNEPRSYGVTGTFKF